MKFADQDRATRPSAGATDLSDRRRSCFLPPGKAEILASGESRGAHRRAIQDRAGRGCFPGLPWPDGHQLPTILSTRKASPTNEPGRLSWLLGRGLALPSSGRQKRSRALSILVTDPDTALCFSSLSRCHILIDIVNGLPAQQAAGSLIAAAEGRRAGHRKIARRRGDLQ